MNKELCYGYPCISETISSDFLVSRFRLKLIWLKTAQKWFVVHIKVKEVDVSLKNNVLVNLTCLQILIRWVPLGPVTVYSSCSIIRVINWYLHLIKLHICHIYKLCICSRVCKSKLNIPWRLKSFSIHLNADSIQLLIQSSITVFKMYLAEQVINQRQEVSSVS